MDLSPNLRVWDVRGVPVDLTDDYKLSKLLKKLVIEGTELVPVIKRGNPSVIKELRVFYRKDLFCAFCKKWLHPLLSPQYPWEGKLRKIHPQCFDLLYKLPLKGSVWNK